MSWSTHTCKFLGFWNNLVCVFAKVLVGFEQGSVGHDDGIQAVIPRVAEFKVETGKLPRDDSIAGFQGGAK